MDKRKGFEIITIPARSFNSCRGCIHLVELKTFFGHRDIKAHYTCVYPQNADSIDNIKDFLLFGGQFLNYCSVSDELHTPLNCPYLNDSVLPL